MDPHFHTTRWSMVVSAGAGEHTCSRTALSELCQLYWYPLYAFARRRGNAADAAEDLVQGFFAELLEKNWLEAADPVKGRFRAYLITTFKRHLSRDREHRGARKRGGDRVILSLDFSAGERLYAGEPAGGVTPERVFERRWALTILQRVMQSLQAEMTAAGKQELFQALRPFLAGTPAGESYAAPAERLEMTTTAIKTAMHRLRGRYREALRAEIAETVTRPEDVDEEINDLIAALRA